MWVPALGQADLLRRKCPPTPMFLPGKSHWQRNLEGYSPECCKESHMTKQQLQKSQNRYGICYNVALYFNFFWLHAWGILASWPGIDPKPPALDVEVLINHWTTSEVPLLCFFNLNDLRAIGFFLRCTFSFQTSDCSYCFPASLAPACCAMLSHSVVSNCLQPRGL